MISKAELNKTYLIALLLSTSVRKTCESLGREINLCGEKISKLLDQQPLSLKERIESAKKIMKCNNPYILIDDTIIDKRYSQRIEGTSDNFSSSEKVVIRSLCSVVGMLSNGKVAIPVHQEIWTSLEMGKENYATKTQLAQRIIANIREYTEIGVVIMDGLYATQTMIQWCIGHGIKFEMKFASNRKIAVNNQSFKIRDCSLFKLKGYRTERTIKASWKEINLYFTAIKRWNKYGESTIIYQVSNYKTSAWQHKKLYVYRWNIEKFFRTAKQHLGLKDCQSLKLEKQKNHILNVFAAYSIAQFECIKLKYKNVEQAIKSIKTNNLHNPNYAIKRSREVFQYA